MLDQPDELMIELKKPLVFNSKSIDVITLSEPTIGQINQAQKKAGGFLTEATSLTFITELVTLISNVAPQFISQMKYSDMMKASDYLMGFITPSQKTTEISPPT
jgi:hypothetical protein